MILDKEKRFLLFDFLTFIVEKLNLKDKLKDIDYLGLIRDYEISRRGKK